MRKSVDLNRAWAAWKCSKSRSRKRMSNRFHQVITTISKAQLSPPSLVDFPTWSRNYLLEGLESSRTFPSLSPRWMKAVKSNETFNHQVGRPPEKKPRKLPTVCNSLHDDVTRRTSCWGKKGAIIISVASSRQPTVAVMRVVLSAGATLGNLSSMNAVALENVLEGAGINWTLARIVERLRSVR